MMPEYKCEFFESLVRLRRILFWRSHSPMQGYGTGEKSNNHLKVEESHRTEITSDIEKVSFYRDWFP